VLSIGEFSHVAHLTIKALRHYHDQGLLVPELVDEETGYRYYGPGSLERARAIQALKEMGFSLAEIATLLAEAADDADLGAALARKVAQIETEIKEQKLMQKRIREFLDFLKESEEPAYAGEIIAEEQVPEMLVLGLRHQGSYQEIGRLIGMVFRKAGRHAAGGPFCLYYDGEYKEDGADFEVCVPARARVGIEGLDCRTLAGGRAFTLIHNGSYETLGTSYAKLFEHLRKAGASLELPIRETYLKGPGIIIRGDPARYRTRLMVMAKGG
jgi:DNA-binding transcriptional MerR regulator/effector-binding domain-containing protein